MMRNEKKMILQLLKLFSRFKIKLFFISLCLLLIVFSSLLLPVANKNLIDEGIMAQSYSSVVLFVAAVTVLMFTLSIAELIKEKLRARIAAEVQQQLYEESFDCLLDIDISYFNGKNSTEVYNNLEIDISKIVSVCDDNVFFVITQILSFLGGIIGLFIIDVRLAVIVMFFIPIKFIVVKLLCRVRKKLTDQYLNTRSSLSDWYGDNLNGIRDIRLFDLKDKKRKELKESVGKLVENNRKLSILDSYNFNIDTLLVQVLESSLYLLGAVFVFDHSLSIGSLFAFINYSMQVANPISSVLNINYMLAGILPSAKRYYNFIEECALKKEDNAGDHIKEIETIEFKDVHFSHQGNCILNGVSFTIHKGEKVALVGKNGSGKSTIFNLIERFISPDKGEIFVNGRPIHSYAIEPYRASFSCVNQNAYLFNVSLHENIFFEHGKSKDKQKMQQIIEKSLLETTVHNSKGNVGSNGCSLSGGQRQKVLYARMLYKEKQFYLFDEATSNMDQPSKQKIHEAFTTSLKEKTVLMITHEPNLLQNVDKVLYINKHGEIDIYKGNEKDKAINMNILE